MLVAEPCMTVYNPMDCALPGSSVRGILQARTLEWVDISFSMWHGRGTKMTEKSTSQRKNIRHDPVKVESQEKHEAFFQLPSSLKKKKKSRLFEFSILPFSCISPFHLMLFQLLLSFSFLWINPLPFTTTAILQNLLTPWVLIFSTILQPSMEFLDSTPPEGRQQAYKVLCFSSKLSAMHN